MTRGVPEKLVREFAAHKIGRRALVTKASAAGASATAVLSAIAGLRTPSSFAQENRTVTFWTSHGGRDLESLERIVDAYNANASGHQVGLVQVSHEQLADTSTLMAAVRDGVGPDAYLLDRFIVAERASAGLLQDLGPLGGDEVLGNYLEFARAEASFRENAFALPFDTDVRALFYNKTMLSDAGIDPSELDPSNGPLTWERIAEIAGQIDARDGSGAYSRMGFVPWINQGWHYTYGFSWGGSFFDAAECRVTPDDPAIVDAFAWVRDFCVERDANLVDAFGSPSMQPGFAGELHPFLQGTLAMQISGDWQIASQAQHAPAMDYGVTKLPAPARLALSDNDMGPPGGSSTWSGGWSMVIPQGARNTGDAWSFIQFAAGPDGQRIYSADTSRLPTWSDLLDESLFDEAHRFFLELLPESKNRPPLPVGDLYWNELTAAYRAVYLGQVEPDVALAAVAASVNSALGDFCPV